MHIKEVSDQTPFFITPTSPRVIAVRHEIPRRRWGETDVMGGPNRHTSVEPPVVKLKPRPKQIPKQVDDKPPWALPEVRCVTLLGEL